jgi:hypothetical protein
MWAARVLKRCESKRLLSRVDEKLSLKNQILAQHALWLPCVRSLTRKSSATTGEGKLCCGVEC